MQGSNDTASNTRNSGAQRIEAICFRRERAFAARLPDSAELQEGIARYLEWYQANPEQFSDAHFQEAYAAGGIEGLRYLGSPDWLILGVHANHRPGEEIVPYWTAMKRLPLRCA